MFIMQTLMLLWKISFFFSTRKIFYSVERKKTTITIENLLALWTSCGEILKPNQVEPHLLRPYGTDHLQSISKASLLAWLIEEREEQLGTHADKLQTHTPVYMHSSEYILENTEKNRVCWCFFFCKVLIISSCFISFIPLPSPLSLLF